MGKRKGKNRNRSVKSKSIPKRDLESLVSVMNIQSDSERRIILLDKYERVNALHSFEFSRVKEFYEGDFLIRNPDFGLSLEKPSNGGVLEYFLGSKEEIEGLSKSIFGFISMIDETLNLFSRDFRRLAKDIRKRMYESKKILYVYVPVLYSVEEQRIINIVRSFEDGIFDDDSYTSNVRKVFVERDNLKTYYRLAKSVMEELIVAATAVRECDFCEQKNEDPFEFSIERAYKLFVLYKEFYSREIDKIF